MSLRSFFCSHKDYRRERDAEGRLLLVCLRCDKAALAIARDDADAKALRTLEARMSRSRRDMAKAAKAKAALATEPAPSAATPPANVTPIGKRRQA